MKIIFSLHARKRIFQRSIAKSRVREAVLEPDWYEPTFGGRIKVQKGIKQKTLEVIYFEQGECLVVITAYFL